MRAAEIDKPFPPDNIQLETLEQPGRGFGGWVGVVVPLGARGVDEGRQRGQGVVVLDYVREIGGGFAAFAGGGEGVGCYGGGDIGGIGGIGWGGGVDVGFPSFGVSMQTDRFVSRGER